MSKRNLFLFFLITAVFVAATAIPTNPNAGESYYISGIVLYNGSPLQGVEMNVSTGGAVDTNEHGYYSVTVSSDWSGTVTPTLLGYSFDPYSRDYSYVTSDQVEQDYIANTLMASRNVNMVSVDPFLQRQNEPSLAVSTLNPRHLLAGANDYSLVNFNGDEVDVTYDAWLGVFKSLDGGESWDHDLLPPWQRALLSPGPPPPQADQSELLFGFEAAADPTVRAGLDGWFYYSGIAFDREKNGDSVIFVCRYKPTEDGSDIEYHDTKIIDIGTSGQFSDKPWTVVDVPSPGYPDGIVYIVYSIFMGQIDPKLNIHSKILICRSTDRGETWEQPVKVSESEQKNQGTTVALNPNDGTVYVAWRRFADANSPDGILITKSEDFAKHFTKSVEIAAPNGFFHQETIYGGLGDPAQFRTYAYPVMAVDQYGTIHVAWSQRDVDTHADYRDDARIVLASQAETEWGAAWTYVPVESPVTIYDSSPNSPTYMTDIPIHSHQFMPSLTCGAGNLMISWYDNRYSARVFDEYGNMRLPPCDFGENTIEPDRIIDGADSCPYRETIDVRAAQAIPSSAYSLDIKESVQVSRYFWFLEEDPETEGIRPKQGQFNPPNYKLFRAGTAPFHGDYLDIVSAPQLVEGSEGWRFSKEGDPLVYYVSWTDNRDVLPPPLGLWGWNKYYPPNSQACEGIQAGMRNQNIYVSKLAPGIEVGILGEFKKNFDGVPKEVFVIYINNKTSPFVEPDYKRFELSIPLDTDASFFPGKPPEGTNNGRTIIVSVPDNSSISRMVFVTSATYPFDVQVTEKDTGDFTDSISLKPGISLPLTDNTSITEYQHGIYDFVNWNNPPLNPGGALANPNIITPNIITPNIITPNIITPNIITHNIVSPNIITPNIITPNIITPNIITPNIITPNIITNNMSIINPNIITPNILTTSLGADIEVVDKIWTVKNDRDAVSSYTFKSIAGDSLPTVIDYLQLLIFKAHITPSTDGCALKDKVQHELLINITNPDVIDAANLTPDQIKNITGDPLIEIENATFALGPYEEGIVILRVIDNHPSGSPASGTPPTGPTEAEGFASNVGGLAVTHTSTEENPVGAVGLMILPDTLPAGTVGVSYPSTTLRAIGGTGTYSWITVSDSLPPGLEMISGVISGCPSQAGVFNFTVQVTTSQETDTQSFSIEIVDPVLLEVIPESDIPDGMKGSGYSGNAKFRAKGGVKPYTKWELYAVNNWTGNPVDPINDLGLTLSISGDDGEKAELIGGTPLLAGEFTITVEVFDNSCPQPEPATLPFFLCVRPKPLSISITPPLKTIDPPELVDGFLGDQYDVEFQAQNWELPLSWTVDDSELPPGLSHVISSGPTYEKMKITGIPTYNKNKNYPADYSVTVTATDGFLVTCADIPRKIEKTFTITIYPKAPAWSVEGVDGEATAIAADRFGNVYVTGYTNGANKDYYTAKIGYNTQTESWEEVWSKTYNGPGNGEDIPSAIAVFEDSSSGRVYVYVTGTSDGGAKTSGPDIYTVAYDPSLSDPNDVIWEARYDGPSHLGDGANAMTVDTAGNVYVAGFVHRGKQKKHADYCTLKYDKSTGELLWDETYDSRRNGEDVATAIAVDLSGYVYVTGKSHESLSKVETSFDYLTLMYNSAGSLQREVRDDGPGFGNNEPTDIALYDESGIVYVYVTGYATAGNAVKKDYYTAKYNANEGIKIWGTYPYNGPGNGDDVATAIALDSSGNAFVTGKSWGGTEEGNDYATIKYGSENGVQLWHKRYDGQVGNDEAVGIAVEGTDIYVAGFITTGKTRADYFVINYGAAAGDITWIGQYPLPGGLFISDEIAVAMTTDATGIYVTGYSVQSGISRFATVKFNK